MKRLAILASGQGTNMEAILKAIERGEVAGRVVLVLSDRADAPALRRARARGIKSLWIDPSSHPDRAAYDRALLQELNDAEVELVILAGFMRLLSPVLIRPFRSAS